MSSPICGRSLVGNEGSLQFTGYASVFGGVDSYGDMIMKGAYENTIKDRERPVQLRWNHFGPVIGKYTEIYEDEKGLVVSGELTKGHSVAEDTAALLRHGAISGLSIGYIAKNATQDGVIRKLTEIDLFEVSVVESPADNAPAVDHVPGVPCQPGIRVGPRLEERRHDVQIGRPLQLALLRLREPCSWLPLGIDGRPQRSHAVECPQVGIGAALDQQHRQIELRVDGRHQHHSKEAIN